MIKNSDKELLLDSNNGAASVERSDTDDLGNLYFLLEPPLQPVPPDENNPISMALFEEHKSLVVDFLKLETEKAFALQRRKKLREEQSRANSIQDLKKEQVELLELKQCLEAMLASSGSDDEFVML